MIGNTAQLIAYAAARGVTVAEDEAPVLLVKATDYLNRLSWVGDKNKGQEDCWPRSNFIFDGTPLFDDEGAPVTETTDPSGTTYTLKEGDTVYSPAATPKTVVNALYKVALIIAEGLDLDGPSGGAQVLQEAVSGAVSITYAESTVGDTITVPGLADLLDDWLDSPITSGINFNVYRG